MPSLPAKRLLVYVVAGLAVLGFGTFAVISMRGEPTADGLTIIGGDAGLSGQGVANSEIHSSTTSSTKAQAMYVQVVGAVLRPGVYQVPADARVFQAVHEAGGFTEDADQQAVALASRVTDGCRIYVPRVGEPATAAEPLPVQPGPEDAGPSAGTVSLNSATLEQLDTLPGVGPATARDIITYRETQGPFTSVDQLTEVPGIGPAKMEKLRPLVGL